MRKRKPKAPPWTYAFKCAKCDNIREIHDPAHNRDGDYCVACIERADAGLPGPIHADERDRVVRCDRFTPIRPGHTPPAEQRETRRGTIPQ